MELSKYKIWENPSPKIVSLKNKKPMTQAQWLAPEIIEYTLNGVEKVWESVPRSNNNGVVAVLPVTDTKEILLLEERRIPLMTKNSEGKSIGIPAGLVDPHEDITSASLREMQEEIGYNAEKLHYISRVISSGGLTNEETKIFIAENCKRIRNIIPGFSESNGLFLRHESSELIDAIYSVPYDNIDDFMETALNQGMQKSANIDTALRGYDRLGL